jgi:hypothetical protein
MCISNIRKEYFIILLWKNSLAGSSLQVMGQHESSGQWSIMGGTGQFTMARGVIDRDGFGSDTHGNGFKCHYLPYFNPNTDTNTNIIIYEYKTDNLNSDLHSDTYLI